MEEMKSCVDWREHFLKLLGKDRAMRKRLTIVKISLTR